MRGCLKITRPLFKSVLSTERLYNITYRYMNVSFNYILQHHNITLRRKKNLLEEKNKQ